MCHGAVRAVGQYGLQRNAIEPGVDAFDLTGHGVRPLIEWRARRILELSGNCRK